MSGGGGIIIIRGKNSDGSFGQETDQGLSIFKTLWESIPLSARQSQQAQACYNAVEDVINNVS